MTKHINFKTVRPFIFLILIVSLIYWLIRGNDKQPALKVNEKSWPVQVARVNKTDAFPEITLYGAVDSPKHATLSSTIDTDVLNVLVKEGDVVKKGALLVKLDAEEFNIIAKQKKAAIDEAKAQIAAEITEYQNDLKSQKYLERLVKTNEVMMKRLEKLEVRQLEAQSNVDEALNKLLSQQVNYVQKQLEVANHKNILAQLQAKQKQLESSYQQALLDVRDTNIVAPFDGRITEVFVAPGDDIIPSSKLVSLYSLDDVEVRAQLPQKYLAKTNKALREQKQLVGKILSPIALEIRVLRTGATLKTGSSTIDIFFKIPKESAAQLPLNQTVRLILKLPAVEDVYIIPATSLYGESRIYRVENQRLVSVHVEIIGEKYVNNQLYYLVKKDSLPKRVVVLVSKLPNARDGLKVNIR